ncbi:hypothetical protein BB560_002517 [Smittium megazygosporum]|uniref:Pre-mRNA processing factor 4 (PRP4)-like domain-containing protein n=1 Tax=Smittium megazygosporum TaxID=133381 RepID=A0A2T9ZEK6_9FUNG|nr:hypothetical protein BB560_002517 [Smittium megazygosporum]
MEEKNRIYFGTLEHLATANANNSGEESDSNDNEIIIDEQDVESQEFQSEENKLLLKEFERREIARKMAVPTDDLKVKLKLRELGEPICLFGEGPGDRRDRLRFLMSKAAQSTEIETEQGLLGGPFDTKPASEQEPESQKEEAQTEEFYTEGTPHLLEARKKIAIFSLQMAKQRIKSSKLEMEIPLTIVRKQRKNFCEYYSNFSLSASEFADQRPISKVKFSPNSSTIASASWSGLIKLWDVLTMTTSATLRGHTDRVSGLSFHPQSMVNLDRTAANLASGGCDNKIHLWSLEKQSPIETLNGHIARVAQVEFHPSGNYLASASYDGSWRLWDVKSCSEILLQEGHSREVYCVKFQNDGSLLASGFQVATGGADNTVCIYDLRALRLMHTIPAHTSLISEIVFTNISNLVQERSKGVSTIANSGLVTASFDGSVKIWTLNDYQHVKTLVAHEGKVMGVDVSKADGSLVSAGSDRTFKLYNNE